jgi:hypothetical protein
VKPPLYYDGKQRIVQGAKLRDPRVDKEEWMDMNSKSRVIRDEY